MDSYNIPDAVILCDDAQGSVTVVLTKLTNSLYKHVKEQHQLTGVSNYV
jgi:hypothetical protein